MSVLPKASRSSVIDRVRKLRQMTLENGCTAPEADAARRMAGQLMMANGLTEADLTLGDGHNADVDQVMAAMNARAARAAARDAARAARAAAALKAWEADRKAGRCGRPVHDLGSVARFCRQWESFRRGTAHAGNTLHPERRSS